MKERETSKLYHSITSVDSQFIEEILENSKKKRNRWLKWGAIAACLCLIAVSVATLLSTIYTRSDRDNRNDPSAGTQGGDAAISFDPNNVSFTGISADWPYYPDTESLIDRSNTVVLGTVTGISFQLLDIRTARPITKETKESDVQLYTLYDIEIMEQYKGDLGTHTQVRVLGGLRDQYLEEQVSVLGDRAAYGIPCMEGIPEINMGGTYLFVLYQYEDTAPTLLNPTQSVFSYSSPGTATPEISLQSIVSYFGEGEWEQLQERLGYGKAPNTENPIF